MNSTTPTLDRVINDSIANYLSNLSFCEPATITKVLNNNKVEVRPDLKSVFSGQPISKPVISEVPVIQLRTASAGVSIPVAKGDSCLLLFSERSMDIWLNRGVEVDPKDTRTHHLTDAVALLGLTSFNNFTLDLDPYPDSVVLRNKSTLIRLNPKGKVAIGTKTVELLDLMSSLMGELISTTAAGSPLSSVAAITALKLKLDSIKGSL